MRHPKPQAAALHDGHRSETTTKHEFDPGVAPGHLIRRLQQVAISLFLRRVEALGLDLTPVQFAALSAISAYPGIDQASLAGLIAYDRTTIGGVVEKLEQKGLVARTPSEADKRLRLLSLTATGRKTLAIAAPAVDEAQIDMLAPLARNEQEQFMALLTKLVRHLNESSRVPLRPIDDAVKQRMDRRSRKPPRSAS